MISKSCRQAQLILIPITATKGWLMFFSTAKALSLFLLLCFSSQADAVFKIARMDSPDHFLIMRIIKEAYTRLGIPVEFVEFPGKRSLYESNSGSVDAELSRVFEVGSEFPSLRRVPTPIFWFDATVFSKNKEFKIDGWSSLKDLRVGIMRGMVFAEMGVKGFPYVTVVDKPLNLFKMLDSDRVGVVVFGSINGLQLIRQHKFSAIHPLKPALKRICAYHYVHKRHEALVPKLDAIFQDMEKSGQMEKIRSDFIRDNLR